MRDAQKNQVTVRVSYPCLPPKCCNCGRFGHLLDRCPKPLMRKKQGVGQKGLVPGGTVIAETLTSLGNVASSSQGGPGTLRASNPSKKTRA